MDSVTVQSNACGKMEELRKNGWKDLQYIEHNSWGDCSSPEIIGNRPMTEKEVQEHEKNIKRQQRAELKRLKKLASDMGYDLVKRRNNMFPCDNFDSTKYRW
jgi:hypothetical protein